MHALTALLLFSAACLSLHSIAVLIDFVNSLRSLKYLQRHAWRLKSLKHLSAMDEACLPPITLLIPLQQADLGAEFIRRFIALKYPKIEYLVIHESDNDREFVDLQAHLGLHPVPRFPVAELYTKDIKGVYQSEDLPQLWVIDKEIGGLGDCLNAGLNFCQTPLVAIASSRVNLHENALLQAARPFLEQSNTWSVTGRIRPAQKGQARQLPSFRWGQIETLIVQRQELLDSVLDQYSFCFTSLSEDFNLFKRTVLVEAGGFSKSHPDVMAEIANRLYRLAHMQNDSMQLVYTPDTLGWYRAAETVTQVKQALLKSQQHARHLNQAGRFLPGRFRYMWRRLFLPLIHLLTLLAGLPLIFFTPELIWVWAASILSPAVTWQWVLLLGERTDFRYSKEDLHLLQNEAWLLPFMTLPRLSYWQLKAWFQQSKPVVSIAKPSKTQQSEDLSRSVIKSFVEP